MSARAPRPRWPAVAMAVALALVVGLVLGLAPGWPRGTAEAQTAPAGSPPTEAEVLAVQRQLLCPLCTNERLDVCALAICEDMKQIIRDRLTQGATPDDIILFFESRYGPRVRAELPRTGFNLLLFGWTAGAVALMAVAAAAVLTSMRRASRRHAAVAAATGATGATGAAAAVDDRWLDALIDDAAAHEPPAPGAA